MDQQHTSVEEQVEYGLEGIEENRMVGVSLRDLVYIHNTIGEIIRFFHNPKHYLDVAAVQEFIGSTEAGACYLLAECYYRTMTAMLPKDIQDKFNEGLFDNPDPPYYYLPQNEQGGK